MNYIVELSKDSHEHELVNSCALYIWQDAFKQKTKFFGSILHKQALEKFLPNLSINGFNAITILPRLRGKKMQWIKIYLHEFSTICKIFNASKKDNVNNIVFLSITPFALLFAKIYIKFIPIKSKVIFTYHGELQFLVQDKLRLSEQVLLFLIRVNFSIVMKNIYYVVYGKTIAEKLRALYPKVAPQVISMEHPFVIKDYEKESQKDLFTIGAFGAISTHKNSHKIADLAESMHSIDPRLKFKFVGKFIDPIIFKTDNISVVGGKEFLARQDYEKEISTASWLIYLYEDSNYELIASGAFLDAVLYDKPIICLKNKFFEHIFECYQIGIMVDTIAELPANLDKLFSRKDLDEFYLICQQNLQRYRSDNQITNQSALLVSQLSDKIKF
ncbi:hypothetical protein [Sphingobacterium faecium]